ncbi:hypothetical protein DFH07DRAFT_957235 [Mycena maculata]|uniref:CxC2-like cysteine cluster KDZ transposase-associated domain-containing protein n=1 Tax=Mycena maculata TaxID=230809 RepID=A0AAD7JDD7_9AGAR|nr:hypothetical protein DFH07DRAFT_957235 [Mycena maculata]
MSNSKSHKRKATRPTLVVAGTSSSETFRSSDGRRQRFRVGVVGQDAGMPTGLNSDQFWQDDLATNLARQDPAFTYRLGDNSISSEPDFALDDGIQVIIPSTVRNPNSDRPLKTWYPYADEYVEENLWREGRGSSKVYSKCAGVRCTDPGHVCSEVECTGVPEYRCLDEACLGDLMHCERCIVAVHARLPTHFIERWNGTNFVRKRTALRDLGLRVQLGHPPGVVCPFKQAAPRDFVLYDVLGIHEINVDFCGCRVDNGTPEKAPPIPQLMRVCWWPATVLAPNTCATFGALRLFHTLNCLGKLSACDFLRGLEICTNHDSLDKPPDRRKPFMHIMRQYREGECTVSCRACPLPGWNLPEDWDKIDPFFRYIYFLLLAQDANFQLSNRNVSSEVADPILGDGFGYFCRREGEDGYKAHIAKHVNEQEVSNCSGFQAMFMANTRRVKGLRTTGIGGVTCSRHNMWRPNGIGDLQVGERYCNMDFLLLSALMTFNLMCVVVSYDIACQYAINFWQRMSEMPEAMQLKLAPSNVWWKVPNFHLPPHKKKCHSAYSFHWMWGAGMTHGEGVEQNWSFSNGAAASTRLMGPGGRQATLEDILGFHNYDRVLAMHRVLPKRLAEVRPEELREWRERVLRWELKQHTDSSESPFELAEEVTTLRDIQLGIATEEYICTDDGVEVEHEHTPGTFITMGMELEELQRRLEVDVHALKDPSPSQRLGFVKRCMLYTVPEWT